jgi:uncharacterized protein
VVAELELIDWRRRVSEIYARVRRTVDPEQGHAIWRTLRDELMRSHSQSPLPLDDPLRDTGISYAPYDPAYRFELALLPPSREQTLTVPTPSDGTIALHLIGHLVVPEPVETQLDVWWLHQYGGGVFIPLRDGTAGRSTYGGGRYLLDTAKGADLGGSSETVVLDLNFAYHPSCRYNPEWVCPLAPAGNTTRIDVPVGEII